VRSTSVVDGTLFGPLGPLTAFFTNAAEDEARIFTSRRLVSIFIVVCGKIKGELLLGTRHTQNVP